MTITKPRNGVGGWIVIAMVCGGASGGGAWLRPQPLHNPEITTAAWIQMTRDVEDLRRQMRDLTTDIDQILRRLPQQPQEQP